MKRLFILLLFLLPGLTAFRPVNQAQGITMQIEAGIAGWYRAGQWIPVQVTVESESVNLPEGQLQVRVSSASSSAAQFETTYRLPFNISRGDRKRVFLYVSVNNFADQVQVELVDDSGEVITSQQDDLVQISAGDVLYTVITESTAGILDVSREPIGNGINYQANWSIDDLPPNADALRSIDLLVFSDADTGRLSTEQQQAIEEWVASGGHLIVTGGPNWQRTTAGLRQLLPTEPLETAELENLNALSRFLRIEGEGLNETTLVTANAPINDADVLLTADDIPLVVRDTIGIGTVDFLAVDPSLEPLRSWGGTDRLWYELVISADPRPTWTYGIERYDMLQDAVSNVEVSLPGALQLLGFLLAYVLLIGPINYLLLKAIGKREFAWITIPILIGVFTAFAYFTGFSVRGDAVTVNQVSLVQVWNDYEQARVDGAFGILSPRRTTYDVLVSDTLNLRSVPNETGPGSITEVTITQGEAYSADQIPVDAAIMTSFATSGYVDAPGLAGQATWTVPPVSPITTVEGRISNNMDVDLLDAVILADDDVMLLGDLEAGETRTFAFEVPLTTPQRIQLGTRVDTRQPIRSFNASNCYLPNTLSVLYENVLRGQEFDCLGGDEDDRRMRRRALLLTAISNEIDQNGGRGAGVYLAGWSEAPPLGIEVSTSAQIDSGTVLYIYELPVDYQFGEQNGQITLPPGWMRWIQVTDETGLRSLEPLPDLSFRITGTQVVMLRFMPVPEAPINEVTAITLEMDWRLRLNPESLILALWNWETEAWETLNFDADDFIQNNQLKLTLAEEVAAYIGPQNSVMVRFEAQEIATAQEISNVRVTLRGRS